MEEHQVRRRPVVDEAGRCIGMISQADLAKEAPDDRVTHLLREVSRPTPASAAW